MAYPQQYPNGAWQQPYPQQPKGSAATAVLAGILGLLMAFSLGGYVTQVIIELGSYLGEDPVFLALFITEAIAVLLSLIGAFLLFARQTAGAVMVLVGAILTLATILLTPLILAERSGMPADFGQYFAVLFGFSTFVYTLLAIALILSPFALIFSALPPTFTWLRGRRAW